MQYVCTGCWVVLAVAARAQALVYSAIADLEGHSSDALGGDALLLVFQEARSGDEGASTPLEEEAEGKRVSQCCAMVVQKICSESNTADQ